MEEKWEEKNLHLKIHEYEVDGRKIEIRKDDKEKYNTWSGMDNEIR